MTVHCAVARGCSKDPPVQLHPEVSSALSDGEQLWHTCMQAWQAGSTGAGSTAQPHCLWPQLQQSASFQDMWHFWVLQSMKWWKVKLPRATPSLKCFATASAMLDVQMLSTSHGAVFVSMTHHQREDFTALCATAHL